MSVQKSRIAVFQGSYITLQELREFVMISLADLDGETSVSFSQDGGGMNGLVASTKITVWEHA
jgi:hypothetical protein